MQLHELPQPLADCRCIGVMGVHVVSKQNADNILNQLQTISIRRKVPLQISEATYLCGPKHAFHAGILALKAHQAKRGRARKIEMEILLYLSGKRQIGEAIQSIGIKNNTKKIAVIAVGSKTEDVKDALNDAAKLLQGTVDDKLLEITAHKKKLLQDLFEVSERELEIESEGGWRNGLLKCVMERAAMLDALKK